MRPDRRDPTDWRPTARQHALLSVGLAHAPDLAETWSRHRSTIPVDALDTLDWGARRLVPLVAWRLRESGIDDRESTVLRADLAASMLAARAKLSSFSEVLATLDRAGIEVLVLKGVGVAPLAYPDPGTRPTSDLDVLVRASELAAVEELVERNGGYRTYGSVDPALRARYRHAAEACLAGQEVDVHWRLLVDRFDGGPDAALFDRAREVPVGPLTARTLGVEDHIVHAIAHGLRHNALAPVRWIVDVARLVEHQPVDWSVVEEASARRHLEGVVGRALELVSRRYGVPVPSATLRTLRRASGLTRGRTDLWSRSAKRNRVSGAANVVAVHYVLATRGWPRFERLARYPEYVRFRRSLGGREESDAEPGMRSWHA